MVPKMFKLYKVSNFIYYLPCCADHKEFRLGAMSTGRQPSSGEEILRKNERGLLNYRNLSALKHEPIYPGHIHWEWGHLVSYLRNNLVFPGYELPPSEVTHTFSLAGSPGPPLALLLQWMELNRPKLFNWTLALVPWLCCLIWQVTFTPRATGCKNGCLKKS